MTYGNTFEEVKANLSHQEKIPVKGGFLIEAVQNHDFYLSQLNLNKKSKGILDYLNLTMFIERGKILLDKKELGKGDVIKIPSKPAHPLEIKEDSVLYLFGGIPSKRGARKLITRKTFDLREKYWGKIESIVNDEKRNYAGKRIFMNKNTQSSLEYHVNKKEAYFLQEGKLKIGVRVGRAENKSLTLNPGDVFLINPGLMHMRIALEDSVIFEISTKDDDKDSHLVEDGKTYIHKEID